MFDQYKPKYDQCYYLAEILEKESNYYFKFITCSSINELEIRSPIYKNIFKNEGNDFEIITKLIDFEQYYESFDEDKKKTFEQFGNLPLFFSRINKCNKENLPDLIEKMKLEIYDDIQHSLTL